MQWIALRAPMPFSCQQYRSLTATAAGESSAGQPEFAGDQSAGSLGDSPLLTLLRSSSTRARRFANQLRIIKRSCSPLFAVNPRSRKEWLLLHNLPENLEKKVPDVKEKKVDTRFGDDVVPGETPAETNIELTEKTVRRRSDSSDQSFVEFSNSGPDAATKTGDRTENKRIRERYSDHRQRKRVGSHNVTRLGRATWGNGSPVDSANQPLAFYTSHGRVGDSDSVELWARKQKNESMSGEVIETGANLDSSEAAPLSKKWKNVTPVERHGTRVLQNGTDCDSAGASREGKDLKGYSPPVTPQTQQTPETFKEFRVSRDWRKVRVLESYGQSPDSSDIQVESIEPKRLSKSEFERKEKDSSESSTLRNPSGGNCMVNEKENLRVVQTTTRARGLQLKTAQEAVEGIQPPSRVSLYRQGSEGATGKKRGITQEIPGLLSGNRELVDNNGEKVVEVWKKGRIVKRYKPLGIEFFYGRKKPTRLYGPLNSRGEVPGSDLAPVPRKYRDRCETDQGWNIKEVVAKLLELNHWDDLDLILNQWVGRFNRRNFPPLMLVMTRTGALKHSVRLFTWMKAQRCYRARTDIYNRMIWLYARHYRIDAVRALFKEMQEWRCKPDVDTYNALINVHGRGRHWREAVLFYDRMLRAKVPPSTETYNNLISACGNSGQWEKAVALYEQMKTERVYVDVVTHNTVLTALKFGEQYAMAVEHFEKTIEWAVPPNTVTLNIIISCFSKMERYDEAVQLFNSMISMKWKGCHSDLVTFTTVMHVYALSGQVENVKLIFDMMPRAGIVPNIVAYNTLIGAYASLGMDVQALDIFDTLQKAGFEPDRVSYASLMNAYSKAGKPDDAARVFQLMKKKSNKPNIVTYNTLIDAYSAAGQLKSAMELLPDMDFCEVPPNVVTICSLIVACGRSGEVDKVSSILKIAALRKISLNVNVYNTVISVYLNHGKFEEANKLYAVMKEEGIAPDLVTFAILINDAAKDGNLAQAQMFFDEMLSLDIGLNVEACSALIHAYAEKGLPEPAHAMLTTMKKSGCAPNVLTYTSLIHAYTLAEMPEAAIPVYEEMEALGVELDAVACSALFTVFNKCGQPAKTRLLWEKWREHAQFGTAAFQELSKACSMLADWKMALELFIDMKRAGVHANSLTGNNLLVSLSKAENLEQLLKVHSLDLGLQSVSG